MAFGAQAGIRFASVYSFTGSGDGSVPYAALVQGSNGYFYGTTYGGGVNGGWGTVFSLAKNGALSNLYSFTGADDGRFPQAALAQGQDGNFYGTTSLGGTNKTGTVFKITTEGALTGLYSFAATADDNAYPEAALLLSGDGYFYGTTPYGGGLNGNGGTVFRIGTSGAFTSLHSFSGMGDGTHPQATLIEGSDGNYYGTTSGGGNGAVFKITHGGALTTLYSFSGGNDGSAPYAAVVQGTDRNFYGTTGFGGGTNDAGTVFRISTNSTYATLYSFSGGKDGSVPKAALIQARDAYFYGTTFFGGTNNAGTVFRMSASGALTSLYSFTGGIDGANPYAGLLQASDGSLYGTTVAGGQSNHGTIFRLTILPEFQAMTLTNGTLNLTWSTEPGGTYQLQYSSDLGSTNWTSLDSAIIATSTTLSDTDSISNTGQRFYRVVVVQ